MIFDKLVSGLFKTDLSAAEKNQSTIPTLLEQIITSMDLLAQKASSLNDSWAEEKEKIIETSQEVRHLQKSDGITAAKFEQDILGKITALSSACDSAIAGNKDAEVKKMLASLLLSIGQRKAVSDSD